MDLDMSLSRTQLLVARAAILRLGNLRLKPELCLSIGGGDMHVHARLLSREEEKPERADPQNRGAHGWIPA